MKKIKCLNGFLVSASRIRIRFLKSWLAGSDRKWTGTGSATLPAGHQTHTQGHQTHTQGQSWKALGSATSTGHPYFIFMRCVGVFTDKHLEQINCQKILLPHITQVLTYLNILVGWFPSTHLGSYGEFLDSGRPRSRLPRPRAGQLCLRPVVLVVSVGIFEAFYTFCTFHFFWYFWPRFLVLSTILGLELKKAAILCLDSWRQWSGHNL